MAKRREELELEFSHAKTRPIELVTENGFRIVRRWEFDGTQPTMGGPYPFLVDNPDALSQFREIIVELIPALVTQIETYTRGRITLSSSYWIYCAERHLATYLWEDNSNPPNGRLTVVYLTPQDLDLARRWETDETV